MPLENRVFYSHLHKKNFQANFFVIILKISHVMLRFVVENINSDLTIQLVCLAFLLQYFFVHFHNLTFSLFIGQENFKRVRLASYQNVIL